MRLFVLFLIVTGCGQISNLPFDPPYRPSEKQLLANAIRKRAALRVKQETGLIPFGTAGQMMREVRMLGLSFDYRQPTSVDQGRELLIAAVDALVQAINEEEKIRPYLYHYPFEPKDVEIRIFLRNENGSEIPSGKLCILSALEGDLIYEMEDPQASFPRLVKIKEEPYAEAVEKLRIPIHQATAQR